ncbi:MAG: Gfo/Idh/MocA family oxidoreductase [Lentisphaeraceae bacterium]|nr:Gfo/Idh/MocA family oxidoreductase [Lentisphaeraceae bacterium]
MKTFIGLFQILLISCISLVSGEKNTPEKISEAYVYNGEALRLGIVGLVHDHVHWMMLNRQKYGDIEIVGIVEPDRQLAVTQCKKYNIPVSLIFSSIGEMIKKAQPEAVAGFNKVSEHIDIVEACAPRGIHIMLEKPLATKLKDAERMVELARKYKIELLTNYETSWYPNMREAYQLVADEKIGAVRRILIHAGHRGPVEIGCRREFVEWLTDPKYNGAGALTDFGCYGANLATWIMKGERPVSVSCVTLQIKPHIYPKVDDDAIIILTYPKTQVVIQASWNWPINRKDMEIYGTGGFLKTQGGKNNLVKLKGMDTPQLITARNLSYGLHEPFAMLTSVIKNKHDLAPFGPSSIENNLIVMQILCAAKEASKSARKIIWKDFFDK